MFLSVLRVCLPLVTSDPQPFMRYPDVHGDLVTFSCEGDIWVGDLRTGHADRLTTDAGNEDSPSFSPDGTQIAFHGEYDGLRGAYVMPTTGGSVKRLTYAMNFRSVTGWTPDGSAVLFRKTGTPTNYEYWTAPTGKGIYKRIPLEFASHVWFGPNVDTYCFTRFNRWSSAWFHYIGGMSNQIWVHRNGRFSQITNLAGTSEYPVWCGDRIYFANEQAGKWTLQSISPDGGKPKLEAGPFNVELRELSTDGKQVIFEKGREVQIFDPATHTFKQVNFELKSDVIHTRGFRVNAEEFVTDASLSPSAKRLLVESRGQIVTLPVGEGEARVWKAKPGVRFQHPVMSTDAKSVAYVSDEDGEQQIWIASADGTNPRKLTSGKRQIKSIHWSPDSKWLTYFDTHMRLYVISATGGAPKEIAHYSDFFASPLHNFSPDSKWIVYSRNAMHTANRQIEIFDVEKGVSRTISDGIADDFSPAFSVDGKWIAFLSQRNIQLRDDVVLNQMNTGNMTMAYLIPLKSNTKDPFSLTDPAESPDAKPAETKPDDAFRIDWDGLYDRRIELPIAPGNYSQINVVKDRVIFAGGGAINSFDLGSKRAGVITSGGGFELSKDGSKMFVILGFPFRVVDTASNDIPATAGQIGFGALQLEIDPVAEWKQMYWDAWRLLRDYFYVENMHGVDWNAIGQKYAAFLPSVRSRAELDELIRWMQGELGSSHQYNTTGDSRNIKPRVTVGYLGIGLTMDSGKLKISRIIKGDGFRPSERSPLANPSLGVKEGMYLLQVGGEDVESETEVYDHLLGRVGQTVSLTVNDKPMMTGARVIYVKPVANEERMKYVDWVAKNREYVNKASKGRIGYLHLAAMSAGDMADFVKQYFPQRNKEALIIDARFNNGGYIQTFINNVLGTKLSGYFNLRGSREPWTRQGDVFLGPKCCLINEFAISCGEEFPHRFKDLGIGPLIGRRTMGGEVGSSPGWALVDGGVVNVPAYGMFVPGKGWVIEGAGVSPDIDVPSDPNLWVLGKDAQLDAGVAAMLDALKKNPVKWPVPPADRVRVGKS